MNITEIEKMISPICCVIIPHDCKWKEASVDTFLLQIAISQITIYAKKYVLIIQTKLFIFISDKASLLIINIIRLKVFIFNLVM